jgi:DNA-binding XRE family transcriptional regulator
MSKNNHQSPYQQLGLRLKVLRQKHLESLAEVSGAVEIDTTTLTDIENGIKRPSEDILLLLISHFSAKEEEASKLWELAGYDDDDMSSASQIIGEEPNLIRTPVIVMPIDGRIVYTDMVHVVVNNFGVVMNFMQGTGPNTQAQVVSRIGMSKEHAKSVLEILKQTLEQAEQAATPKALPHSTQPPKKIDKQ